MNIPVIQIVGYKKSGKTTAVCELVKRLHARGLRVGTVKHDAHSAELDTPGTDTWKHHEAGASVTAIASAGRTAVWEDGELALPDLIARIRGVDIIVAEGFKTAGYPKWVLLRDETDLPLLDQATQPIGVSARFPFSHPELPVIAPDDYDAMLERILQALQVGE